MGEKITNRDLRQVYWKCLGILATACLFSLFGISANAAADNELFESSIPVLISEETSTRALTVNPDSWKGRLPDTNPKTARRSEIFPPGSRVVVFVTNIDLLPDEGANAFRVFAEDKSGTRYRLTVENVQKLRDQPWIYGVTLYIYDANGYNGQPKARGEVLITLGWHGNISNRVRLPLGKPDRKVSIDSGDIPTPAPTSPFVTNELAESGGDRGRFMEQAAFGQSNALDFRLRQIGIRRWIEEQFNKSYPTIPYPNFPLKPFDGPTSCGEYGTSPEVDLCHRNHYWAYNNQKWMVKEALYGDDQLRRRVSWALHQIWVVSHANISQQRGTQEYIEILDNNAFGNYRDLMYEMTLSPAMGEYLDMVRSSRDSPNENYPRELLQLFTIGLYELNQDGTFKLDGQGNRIATYDQDKVNQFTKVFTGWRHCNNGNNSACPNATLGMTNYIDPMYLSFPGNHDPTAKTLFNYPGAPNPTIPACSNCTNDANRIAYANDSLNKTLDNIFYHPNVGPYIGKLLIQQLVTSDPSPAYVGRVAAAFNNNGSGERGDMKTVIRAVLLDPEARGSQKTDPTYGKLREPLQYLTNFLRTFNVRAGNTANGVPTAPPASCQNQTDGVFDWVTREMGQDVWFPPTVFNYYPPDYVVPGTDILGPEFALANTGTSFARNNYIYFLSFGSFWFERSTAENPYPYVPCGTSIDLSEPIAWATAETTGNNLIEGLNRKMMHGTMSEAMKTKIRTAINFNVSAELKAKQAVFLIASSSQYQIQK
jgi:uncharacterized protein (DUF1800 family)